MPGQLVGECGMHDTEAKTQNFKWSVYLHCVEPMEGKEQEDFRK